MGAKHDFTSSKKGSKLVKQSGRFEPILDTLAERQSRHLNWERRRDLLYLRTLHKCLGEEGCGGDFRGEGRRQGSEIFEGKAESDVIYDDCFTDDQSHYTGFVMFARILS